ncbi:MAG TPA: twin-arginine translocation signal domain-containing protein [Candidatus Hydrogenedentes bacterium]|nr:twin-arginine translocation signal domain-containing protein [Candidatus Hydrogenedentota bacterium]HIB53381.1 twin-arginine translocation signal domain-containing protein [Nitrospirales bacterium]
MMLSRRTFLRNSAGAAVLAALPAVALAQDLEEGLRAE